MKKSILFPLCLSGLLVSNSVIGADTSFELYQKSNQKFLEDTINELNIEYTVEGLIPKKSSLVLRNIEEEGTTDKKITALVEDQLISALVRSGYTVLERDENAIRRALEEKSSGKNFSIISKEIAGNNGNPIQLNAQQKVGTKTVQIEGISVDDGSRHMVRTHLLGASYIVNYRIQELGINYTEEEVYSQAALGVEEETRRSGIVRIHVRIENAGTGQILMAENLTGTKTDFLSDAMARQLSNYRYSQFYNGYPTNNPDENNIYTNNLRHAYVEYGLVSSQSSSSRLIIGVRGEKSGIGYEATSFDVKETIGGVKQSLSNSFQLLIINNRFHTLETRYGDYDVIAEFGLGSGDMNLKDGAVVDTDDGLAAKVGVGLEMKLINNFSGKFGVDVYVGGAGIVENVFAAVSYRFD